MKHTIFIVNGKPTLTLESENEGEEVALALLASSSEYQVTILTHDPSHPYARKTLRRAPPPP